MLEVRGYDVVQHAYESDRTYPPYITEVQSLDEWLDPASGAQRTTSHSTIGGYEYGGTTIGDARASYLVRDTTLVPSAAVHGALYQTRPRDVWAVLTDWLAAVDVGSHRGRAPPGRGVSHGRRRDGDRARVWR